MQSGWVATYAPGVGSEGEWSAFELDLDELFALVPERVEYRDVITYPPLRQDLAFVVDEAVPAGDLIAAAREAAGEELRDARFLSDYRGDQIPAGKKSIAFSVAFQSAERTLNDDDAARSARRDRRRAGSIGSEQSSAPRRDSPASARRTGSTRATCRSHAG